MAYFDDIYKTIKEKLEYKITITNDGFVVEDFKNIIYHSSERIELKANKARLIFVGINFVVKELQKNLLIICGKLNSLEVVDL